MALPAVLIPVLVQLLGAAARTTGTQALRTAATRVATQGVARGTIPSSASTNWAMAGKTATLKPPVPAAASQLAAREQALANARGVVGQTVPARSSAGQRLKSAAVKVGTFPKRHPIITTGIVGGVGYAGTSWLGHNIEQDRQIEAKQQHLAAYQEYYQGLVDQGVDPEQADLAAQQYASQVVGNIAVGGNATGDTMLDNALNSVGAGMGGIIDDPEMGLNLMAEGTLFVNPEDGYRWTYTRATPSNNEVRYKVSDAKNLLDQTMSSGLPAWNDLKMQMFWGGFYDPETPPRLGDLGGESMQRDIDAINRMLYAANYQYDGMAWEVMLEDRVMQGQALGFPMYDDFETLSAEDLSKRPFVFYADPNDPYNLLKDWGRKNGVTLGDTFLQTNADRIDDGSFTIDDVKKAVREKYIAPRFPAWQKEILEGSDIDDLAMPYKETVARILEKDISEVSLNDPLIMSGLTAMGADGKAGFMPLHEFEKTVKQNDEWFRTSESKKQMDSVVNSVLSGFGFRR